MTKPKLVYTSSGHLVQRYGDHSIVWTAWSSKSKIIHKLPVMCGTMTDCGTKLTPDWKTAWGIVDILGSRMCYRCMYSWAGHLETRWSPPWSYRKKKQRV